MAHEQPARILCGLSAHAPGRLRFSSLSSASSSSASASGPASRSCSDNRIRVPDAWPSASARCSQASSRCGPIPCSGSPTTVTARNLAPSCCQGLANGVSRTRPRPMPASRSMLAASSLFATEPRCCRSAAATRSGPQRLPTSSRVSSRRRRSRSGVTDSREKSLIQNAFWVQCGLDTARCTWRVPVCALLAESRPCLPSTTTMAPLI